MIKVYLFCILLLSIASCKTSNDLVFADQSIKRIEPGKCYFTVLQGEPLDGFTKENSFVLEFVPATFKDTVVIFTEEILTKYHMGKDIYQLPIRDAFNEYKPYNEYLNKFIRTADYKTPKGFVYCLIDQSPEYRTITKNMIKKIDHTLTVKKLVTQSKIIKRYRKKSPKYLQHNQFFFSSGYWSKPKEGLAGSH